MTKRTMTKWLVLGGLVLLVGGALADYNVQDKGSYYNNASTGLKTNSTGDLRVESTNPPQSFAVFEPGWLTTNLMSRCNGGLPPGTGVYVQDSTSAVNVAGCTGLALMIYPTFDDSLAACAVALQVRWHTSSVVDSVSTFVEGGTRIFPTTTVAIIGVNSPAAPTARDSLGSLTFVPLAANGASRYSAGLADSLAYPDEQVIVFTNTSGTNRGRLIRIATPGGMGVGGPYMSIRLRYLNGYGGTTGGVTYGQGNSGTEPGFTAGVATGAVRLSCSLVGWR